MNALGRLSIGICLIFVAGLNMGNTGCQKEQLQKPKTRVLRRSVDIRDISVQNIQVPQGQIFDFNSVTQWQMQDLLNRSERYIVTLPDVPHVTPPNSKLTLMSVEGVSADEPSIADQDGEAFWQEQDVVSSGDISLKGMGDATGVDANSTAGILAIEEDPYWPSCLKNKSHLVFRGQISSFVLTSQQGGQIGYTPGGVLPVSGINIDFQMKTASLDLRLQAADATWGWLLASGQATSKETETRMNATINLGMLALSWNSFFTTPLVRVTENAITMSLNRLNAEMDEMHKRLNLPAWEGRVLPGRYHNTHVLINGGRMHGIRPGDRFLIHNAQPIWEGEICKSNLLRRELSLAPDAVVEVGSSAGELGDNYTYAMIVQGRGELIRQGASVLIDRLIEDQPQKKQ